MAAPPEHVLTARLVGGDLDGLLIEIERGQETLTLGPPMVIFGPPLAADNLRQAVWEYRFDRIEEDDGETLAIFELVGTTTAT